jgi:hypothetical protein
MSRPVALEYGALLHRRGFGTFAGEFLEAVNGVYDSVYDPAYREYVTYILGFITHAFLDRAAHPYIIYKAGWVSRPDPETAGCARAHAFLERILDALMLEYLRGRAVSSWDQEGLLAAPCAYPPPGLKAFLMEALRRAFPERAGQDHRLAARVENTFTDCAIFYTLTAPALTSPRCCLLREDRRRVLQEIPLAYLYPERLPLDVDYLNLARAPWYYPAGGGGEDRRSFPELYHDAAASTVRALEGPLSRFLAGGRLYPEEIAGAAGDNGLSIQDAQGRPCAPSLAEPLPLAGVLEGQRLLRS